MRDFRFFRGYIDKEIISQIEYNRRRDIMAEEEYRNEYYNQMRKLDELLEEQRFLSQQKLKINPSICTKIKMFFQKIYIYLLYGN